MSAPPKENDMTLNRNDEKDKVFNATAREGRLLRLSRVLWAVVIAAVLVGAAWLFFMATSQPAHAEVFPAGYVPGRPLMGEIYVDGTPRVITLPAGAHSVSYSFKNGSAAHPSTVPVYFTAGETTAPTPTIAVPTAGHPTLVNFIDPGEPFSEVGAFHEFSLVTDGTACYVRYSIHY
jgi:hypothetical protein